MELRNNTFQSTVGDVINYDLKGRTNNLEPSVQHMFEEILRIKNQIPRITASVKQELNIDFYYQCNIGEGHGLQSVEQIERFSWMDVTYRPMIILAFTSRNKHR